MEYKEIKIPITQKIIDKKKAEALEGDICAWLYKNRNLTYEEKLEEIISSLETLNISPEFTLTLAAHMFVRMDNALLAIEHHRKLESFTNRGFKHLKLNRSKARKKRTRGKPAHIEKIKEIMKPFKNAQHSFKEFLSSALNSSFSDLEITPNNDKTYNVRHEDFEHPLNIVKEKTILSWYTSCNKQIS